MFDFPKSCSQFQKNISSQNMFGKLKEGWHIWGIITFSKSDHIFEQCSSFKKLFTFKNCPEFQIFLFPIFFQNSKKHSLFQNFIHKFKKISCFQNIFPILYNSEFQKMFVYWTKKNPLHFFESLQWRPLQKLVHTSRSFRYMRPLTTPSGQ